MIDYGHVRTSSGETLQAVSAHAVADPWEQPGTRDLTAHVDFQALAGAAAGTGIVPFGPIDQGAWLQAMGIDLRAKALAAAAPERAEEIEGARRRLVARDQMGSLFKVMGLAAAEWPAPAGFA